MLHVLRDPMTLFFTLFVPICELLMLGYAIDFNVRHVRTVVYDQARTQESRQLITRFVNSEDFRIVGEVFNDEEMSTAIVSGRAVVGIKIPEDYSRLRTGGKPAQFLVLVDGSVSAVAGEALNASNALALRESLAEIHGDKPLPVEARPRVLFNPDTRSANFFIPGLMVVMCQMMATMLTANTIVREKENGTLEQLFMTPVRATEMVLGKVSPYLFLTLLEFCAIAGLMVTIFAVPVNGSFLTLLALAVPFVLTMLGMGLWISTKASTRDAAQQMSMGTVIPSIFLSGYIFPVDSMPPAFWWVAQFLPTTWLIDASRGVIIRGAGWPELWQHALVLWGMAVVGLCISMFRFQKQL